jgi:RNA-binding protein
MEKKKHVFAKELTSQQRAKLKGLAHPLKPVVQIGGGGFSETIVAEIAKALAHHELIKIQLPGQTAASQKKEETESLATSLPGHAHIVSRIGRMIILYLEKAPSEDPKIKLASL